jgi:EAL domain-containing protein (putative c-di-GMP-specific phosphodiesterase class I)
LSAGFRVVLPAAVFLPDRTLIGAEALLRWKSREYGYIPPGDFIPVAEEIDYILDLGKWVMGQTIFQSRIWNNRYGPRLKVGFNVSPKQLGDDTILELLQTLKSDPDFNTDWIDAEVTESVMIKDEVMARQIFGSFRALGISVSIDDFGTGYSSLGILDKFPFDRIKIDKSLIGKLSPADTSGVEVVRAIIGMANALGVKTLAEGVETQEQLDILIKLGCDQVQGYLLGRPVPAAVFEEMFIQTPAASPVTQRSMPLHSPQHTAPSET